MRRGCLASDTSSLSMLFLVSLLSPVSPVSSSPLRCLLSMFPLLYDT